MSIYILRMGEYRTFTGHLTARSYMAAAKILYEPILKHLILIKFQPCYTPFSGLLSIYPIPVPTSHGFRVLCIGQDSLNASPILR